LEFLSQEIRRILSPGGLNIYTVRHTGDAHYRAGIHRGEDLWEVGDFIVHFFSREKVEHLAKGYEMATIEEFEEGDLPRKLFFVAQRKSGDTTKNQLTQRNKHDWSGRRDGRGIPWKTL
jgi:hypothetical protein